MKLYVTGLDEQGRSAVLNTVESEDFLAADVPVRNHIWSGAAAREDGVHDEGLDLDCPPGQLLWRVVRMDAGRVDPIHHTDTVDFDTVLSGQIDLVLDDARVTLLPGDAVVLPGVAHGWSVGPDGCVLSVVLASMND